MQPSVTIIVAGLKGSRASLEAWRQGRIEQALDATVPGRAPTAGARRPVVDDIDSLNDRDLAAGADALDRLWGALPDDYDKGSGDAWARYSFLNYLLQQLRARIGA